MGIQAMFETLLSGTQMQGQGSRIFPTQNNTDVKTFDFSNHDGVSNNIFEFVAVSPKPHAEANKTITSFLTSSTTSHSATRRTSFSGATEHQQHHQAEQQAETQEQMEEFEKNQHNLSKEDKQQMKDQMFWTYQAGISSCVGGFLAVSSQWMEMQCGRILLSVVKRHKQALDNMDQMEELEHARGHGHER